jgi:hypothetical protein
VHISRRCRRIQRPLPDEIADLVLNQRPRIHEAEQ